MEDQPSFQKLKDPYICFLEGDWKGFVQFFRNDPSALTEHFSAERDTAFQFAPYCEDWQVFQQLVELVKDDKTMWELLNTKSLHGYTPLHCVAVSGNVEIARIILRLEKRLRPPDHRPLLEVKNILGETPVYLAAVRGRIEVLERFAEEVDLRNHYSRDADKISALHLAVIGQKFENALWLMRRDEKLAYAKEDNELTSLQLLAKMPFAFRSHSTSGVIENLISFCFRILPDPDDDYSSEDITCRRGDEESGQMGKQSHQHYWASVASRVRRAICKVLAKALKKSSDEMWEKQKKYKLAEELVQILVQKDKTWEKSGFKDDIKAVKLVPSKENQKDGEEGEDGEDDIDKNPDRFSPLLIAASTGISEIVKTVLINCPQAIEHIGPDGQNILHIAIKYRQLEIFRLIQKHGGLFRVFRLNSRVTRAGNTILHHAASTKYYREGKQPGYAFQLQAELQWFHRVKTAIPGDLVAHYNNANKVAEEFFMEKHFQMLTDAREWIKETAQSCSAVAILVATVVFAAAYTVPGGTNEQGLPVFLHSPLFLFFAIMDVISLASSLASVVMFLSILTSPCEMWDFHKSLPQKLVLGFATLFFSMVTTMLTFSATILLTIQLEKNTWTATLTYAVLFFPVSLYALLQFPVAIKFVSRNFVKWMRKKYTLRMRSAFVEFD